MDTVSIILGVVAVAAGLLAVWIALRSDQKMARIVAMQFTEKLVVLQRYLSNITSAQRGIQATSVSDFIEQAMNDVRAASHLVGRVPNDVTLRHLVRDFQNTVRTFVQQANNLPNLTNQDRNNLNEIQRILQELGHN